MGDIVCIDLETTGVDIAKDRIVEIAVIRGPSLESIYGPIFYRDEGDRSYPGRYFFHSRVNPGIEIPSEATEVHGITNADVAGCRKFSEIASEVISIIDSAEYLTGFNIRAFDVPLLWEEFNRAGVLWDVKQKIIDSMIIYKKMFPRTLKEAVREYAGFSMDDQKAHAAYYDSMLAALVLHEQSNDHDMSLDDLESFGSYNGKYKPVDLAGKIGINEQGVEVWAFGAKIGQPVRHTMEYAQWVLRSDFSANTKLHVRRILLGVEPKSFAISH